MSSSDEEELEFPLAKYGTPFQEADEVETVKKPIAVHEQIVTDEQGRRRFHGAFTGGFSAGYYNTVDTKEGWTPTTFRSSRADRTGNKTFVPEDFMDDEDMSEFGIAPKKIVPQSPFRSSKTTDQKTRERKENFPKNATMLLGFDMLQSLIIPVSNNIGVKLLQRMGWKPGQGIGAKVKRPKKIKMNQYLPENVTFAPEDCVPMEFMAKANAFGLGYTGMDPKQALHDKVKKSSAISTHMKSGQKLSFAGQAFGVGAYEEEDQDIYAQDSIANYDMIMSDEKFDDAYGWSKPTKAITGGEVLQSLTYIKKVLEGFAKAEKLVRRKIYRPPLLPPDFDPNKRLSLQQKRESLEDKLQSEAVWRPNHEMAAEQSPSTQNSNKRELKRGGFEQMDQKNIRPSDFGSDAQSVFSLLSTKDRDWLERIKQGINREALPPKVPVKSRSYEPFSSDPAKQSRYKQYLEHLKKKDQDPYSQIEHDPNMTEWDREQEREEFVKSSRFFQPLSATMSSRFATESDSLKQQDAEEDAMKKAVKMKLFGMLTRKEEEWHPDSLLCKRFNVPNPYPHSVIVGIPGRDDTGQTELFLHPDDFKRTKPRSQDHSKRSVDTSIGSGTGIISDTRNPPANKTIGKSSRWDKTATPKPKVLEPEELKPISENSEQIEIPPPTVASASPKEESSEPKMTQKPLRDLFKAIFDTEDSSSDDESDSETIPTAQSVPTGGTSAISEEKNDINLATKQQNKQTTTTKPPPDVNKARYHKFSIKKNRTNSSETSVEDEKMRSTAVDVCQPTPLPEKPSEFDVNRPHFHKFSINKNNTDADTTAPHFHVATDLFGPILPPAKALKTDVSAGPTVCKPKKRKHKHKKQKHKKSCKF